jgi:cysteine synthase
MSDNRTRVYIGISFLAGIFLTLGFKDVYPELETRFRRMRRRYSSAYPQSTTKALDGVQLRDNTNRKSSIPEVVIPEGIEGCIGNTPLFKIRSLSEATGCEILVKAEVKDWDIECNWTLIDIQ